MEARWWIRASLLGAAVAAMMIACGLWGDRANPPITLCLLKPDEFDGARLWNAGVTVTDRGIDAGGVTVECVGLPAGLAPGDVVAVSGTFRAPATLVVDEARRLVPFKFTWLLYGASAAALLAIVAYFFSQFRPAESPI